MGEFMERAGYPGASWRRPVLWSLFLLFMVLQPAWTPSPFFGGRVISGLGIVVVSRHAFKSWRKHHQPLPPPLGRVEWPQTGRK